MWVQPFQLLRQKSGNGVDLLDAFPDTSGVLSGVLGEGGDESTDGELALGGGPVSEVLGGAGRLVRDSSQTAHTRMGSFRMPLFAECFNLGRKLWRN